MKQRTLLLLTVITVIVAAAAIINSRSRAPQSSIEKPLLFPKLGGRINDVDEIDIQGKGKSLNLVKKGDDWNIRQAGGYPALFTKVKPVIIGISDLRVLDKKTSNPELYPRLGVEDPGGKRAESYLVTLKSGSGDLASLIVGHRRKSSAPGGSEGLYVRLPGQATSLLVEGNVDISSDVTDWIERTLFNIAADRIKSIGINHPGEDELVLSRDSDVGKFTIKDLPKGKEPESDVILSRMQTLLENFFIRNIKSRESVQFPEAKVVTTVRTFDGLVATITSARVHDENLSHFGFGFDESAVQKSDTAPVKGAEDKKDAPAKPDVKAEAEGLNQKYSPWVFVIPDFKFDLLTKEKDKLIKDKTAKQAEKAKS